MARAIAKIVTPKTQLATAANRLASVVEQQYGSKEMSAFILNTWADNLENGEEPAFITGSDGKARIKRFTFVNDKDNKKRGKK